MIKDPMTKMISNFVDGHPREASTRDHNVGKSKSRVPVWLKSRMRLAKAWSRGVWRGSEESEGEEAGINISELGILQIQAEIFDRHLLRCKKGQSRIVVRCVIPP
jgi:hypothetical protein